MLNIFGNFDDAKLTAPEDLFKNNNLTYTYITNYSYNPRLIDFLKLIVESDKYTRVTLVLPHGCKKVELLLQYGDTAAFDEYNDYTVKKFFIENNVLTIILDYPPDADH